MPKGYIIFIETINDQAGYDRYIGKVVPTLMKHRGTVLVAQDESEVIEGEWPAPKTVVLEFDSVEAARDWYQSPEYQAVIGDRPSSADAAAAIVGGFEMPTG
jgi:uncharacterized protein (DUF1330 family)